MCSVGCSCEVVVDGCRDIPTGDGGIDTSEAKGCVLPVVDVYTYCYACV